MNICVSSQRVILLSLFAFLFCGWVTGCGFEKASQENQADSTTPEFVTGKTELPSDPGSVDAADLTREHLLAKAPKGWVKVYESLLDSLRLVEYVPEGSSSASWQEKLSFESFSHKPLPDPIELITSIAHDQKETCEGFEDHNTFSGYENNYPTSVRLLICKNDKLTQQGQVTLIKTIQGEDSFYVITRARRTPPITQEASDLSAADMAQWSLHMRAISVCDPSRENHPCPTPEDS